MERTIEFNKLPKTVDELKALDAFDMTDPFKVAAYAVAALCEYPENKDNCTAMLNLLKGPSPLSNMDLQFIRDRFMDGKDYVPRSYFAGATPANNYAPEMPLRITVKDNPYSRDNDGYIVLYMTSGGADSPRQITLRNKPSTGEWFLWNFGGVLMSIRIPVAQDPWA